MILKVLESPVADKFCRDQIISFIHGEAWLPFFLRELKEQDEHYRHWHVVMEENSKLTAHCHVCQSVKNKDFAQFTFLEVLKDFQGLGLAKKIYHKAMDILKSEGARLALLETSLQNIACKHIYLKDGFEEIFVSSKGDVSMAKAWGQSVKEYVGDYLVPSGACCECALEYPDYLPADMVLNLNLNRMSDKRQLPLNTYGRKGAYCLFRDNVLFPGLTACVSGNKIIDVKLEQ